MNNEQKWIKKQEKVYANEGFDEPDRLVKNIGIKEEKRFTELINLINRINTKYDNMKQISVLDAGGASGGISFYLVNQYDNLFSDVADLPQVIKKIQREHEKVNLIPIDFNKKFPEFSYDIIYATEMIEHIYNDWFFIKNCYEHLKKGGYLIITAPMLETMFGGKDSLHIRVYPAKQLESLLELAGFKIEKSWEKDGRKRIVAKKGEL